MRTAVLIAVSALALASCNAREKSAAPPAPSPPAAAPAPAAPTESAQPTPPAETSTPPVAAPTPSASPAPAPSRTAVVRWSPADYATRERRLAALIANAETRDGSGETQSRAAEGRYRRSHCASTACIESAYAAEEAWLRQWEGAEGQK